MQSCNQIKGITLWPDFYINPRFPLHFEKTLASFFVRHLFVWFQNIVIIWILDIWNSFQTIWILYVPEFVSCFDWSHDQDDSFKLQTPDFTRDLKSNHSKSGNIWNLDFLTIIFQMFRFSKGRAVALVTTNQKLNHSKSGLKFTFCRLHPNGCLYICTT